MTTIAELRAAVARWHRTPATITYRTERQRPGLPESVHQCLRQVVEERTGVAPALRFCDPNGVVNLVWDPPRRWRLDVAEGGTTHTAIVVGERGLVCERAGGDEPSCASRSADGLLRDLPFRELVLSVDETVRGVGLVADGPVTLSEDVVADVSVRCFERRGGASAARWCFADDGALLSLELETEGRAPTIIEAVGVSHRVDDERFDPPWVRFQDPDRPGGLRAPEIRAEVLHAGVGDKDRDRLAGVAVAEEVLDGRDARTTGQARRGVDLARRVVLHE